MSTPTIDPTTDAYADYVAVVVNNTRPVDRARERNITSATVSANVRRIRDAIANGATAPDGTDTPHVDVPAFYAWVTDTYGGDTADAVDMFDRAMAGVYDDRARVVATIDAANARLTDIDHTIAARSTMFGRMVKKGTPTPTDMRDAYTAHVDALRAAATADAPTDDAPTDAS